jgi:hypothetical protein
MEEKDRFDAYVRMAELWLARRNTRRQNHIRLSLAVWAALAASIIYVKPRPPETLLLVVLLVLVLGHAGATFAAGWRHARDRVSADFWIEKSEHILLGEEKMPTWRTGGYRLVDYLSILLWVGPTILLVLAAYLLIGQSKPGG